MQTKTLTKIARRRVQDSICAHPVPHQKNNFRKKKGTTSQDSRNGGGARKSETESINTCDHSPASREWQPSQEPRGTPDKKNKASVFTSNGSGSATAPVPFPLLVLVDRNRRGREYKAQEQHPALPPDPPHERDAEATGRTAVPD